MQVSLINKIVFSDAILGNIVLELEIIDFNWGLLSYLHVVEALITRIYSS